MDFAVIIKAIFGSDWLGLSTQKQTNVSVTLPADGYWHTWTSSESGSEKSSATCITRIRNRYPPYKLLIAIHTSCPPHRSWITTSYRKDQVVWFVLVYNKNIHRRSIRTYLPHVQCKLKNMPSITIQALIGDLTVQYSTFNVFFSHGYLYWQIKRVLDGAPRHTKLCMILLLSKDGFYAAPNDNNRRDFLTNRPHCYSV